MMQGWTVGVRWGLRVLTRDMIGVRFAFLNTLLYPHGGRAGIDPAGDGKIIRNAFQATRCTLGSWAWLCKDRPLDLGSLGVAGVQALDFYRALQMTLAQTIQLLSEGQCLRTEISRLLQSSN